MVTLPRVSAMCSDRTSTRAPSTAVPPRSTAIRPRRSASNNHAPTTTRRSSAKGTIARQRNVRGSGTGPEQAIDAEQPGGGDGAVQTAVLDPLPQRLAVAPHAPAAAEIDRREEDERRDETAQHDAVVEIGQRNDRGVG